MSELIPFLPYTDYKFQRQKDFDQNQTLSCPRAVSEVVKHLSFGFVMSLLEKIIEPANQKRLMLQQALLAGPTDSEGFEFLVALR